MNRALRLGVTWLVLAGLTGPAVATEVAPVWWLLDDARVPQTRTWDAARLSRQSRVLWLPSVGQLLLVRPARDQQLEDTVMLWGDASRSAHEANIQDVGASANTPKARHDLAAEADWQRGFGLLSETWRWAGGGWELTGNIDLPGLIDPALSYDEARGVVILYGGVGPGLDCYVPWSAHYVGMPMVCFTTEFQDATWEYDGTRWTRRELPGPPPPRLRGAMTWDSAQQRTLLFGGRTFETVSNQRRLQAYGPRFPENLTRGLRNDLWSFDGEDWQPLPSGAPPTPREDAQLVFDRGRGVAVLVGGHSDDDPPGAEDRFDLWEHDGVDWVRRFAPEDPRLPPSLRTRRAAQVFWNPARERITVLGGVVGQLDGCPYDDAGLAAAVAATAGDPAAREALWATGCLGGVVHDAWEWDGASLTPVAEVAYGGMDGGVAVFRQVAGAENWAAQGVAGPTPRASAQPRLHPWRYDTRAAHFPLRTALQRAFAPNGDDDGGAPIAGSPPLSPAGVTFASPLLGWSSRPAGAFDPAHGRFLWVSPDAGAVYAVDGAGWGATTAPTSPFEAGDLDFFAATWDGAGQRLVLFDPTTATTWAHTDAGWTQLATTGTAPPVWPPGPTVRREADVEPTLADNASVYRVEVGTALEAVARLVPRMASARERGVTVLLTDEHLYELADTTWSRLPRPPGWDSCEAATAMAHDGARGRTVLVGCTIPGETWEWDGGSWIGPFPGPFQALIQRDRGDIDFEPSQALEVWSGTLQLAWLHPNALSETPSLGGVSLFDADGTLRTWDGQSWRAGPALPDGHTCLASAPEGSPGAVIRDSHNTNAFPFPLQPDQLTTGRDFLPLCLFPPLLDHVPNGRFYVFRDGPKGMLEAKVDRGQLGAWGIPGFGAQGGTLRYPNPYPGELMSAEHVYLTTRTDPDSRTWPAEWGSPPVAITPPVLPGEAWRVNERRVQNLLWPFVVLPDHGGDGRVRVLTHRGALWELDGEGWQDVGDDCASPLECLHGWCNSEGVCCDDSQCLVTQCRTCRGSNPGFCETVAAGQPEPLGRCGGGECAAACDGTVGDGSCALGPARACGPVGQCVDGVFLPAGVCDGTQCVVSSYDPAACPGGLRCADAERCVASCTSREQCRAPWDRCDAGGACVSDDAHALAQALSITPIDWVPPVTRTPAQIAQLFADAGFTVDAQGRVRMPGTTRTGVALAFNPAKQTPVTGLVQCLDAIEACMLANAQLDGCVAAQRRCVGATPWLGDPAGIGCCPEACLTHYLTRRQAGDGDLKALLSIAGSGCYPAAAGGTP